MGRLMSAAALLAAAIGAAEAAAPLELAVSTDLTLVYADHGTGAGQDLSIWNATAPSGWSIVGHAGVSGYSSPDGLLVVRPGSDAAALARPTGLTLQWTNKMGGSTHGSMDGAFYTPVCPSDYGALGSVAIGALSATLADFPDLMCVKEAYLLPPQGSLKNLWKSTPTKFDQDGSVWAQTPAPLPMPFVAGSPSSFAAPPAPHRLDVAKAQVVTMPLKIEQVHLALGHTVDTMAVSWATVSKQPAASAVVMWGTSPGSLTNKMEGNSRKFTQDPGRVWYSHVANMTGLTPATKYYYKVGDAKSGAWSKVFNFQSATTAPPKPGEPQLHVIFGDMGASHAYSLCPDCADADSCTCTNTSLGVVSERAADMILHLGDFAYDFNSEGGLKGDYFMQNIEQIAAYVPYMVSVGNHENAAESLAQYTERFRHMPSNTGMIVSANGVAPNNWFYSWDAGLVHYIAISTETYFGINSVGDKNTCAKQFAFLQQDLAKANANRDKVP